MRIALVIPSLSAGGAERVLAVMANHWAVRNNQVTVLTLDHGDEAPFYSLYTAISHQSLGLLGDSSNFLRALLNNFRRILTLRRALRAIEADAVIAFMDRTSVLTILASAGSHVPVIAYVQNDPKAQPMGRVWNLVRRLVYPRAAALVLQTERVKASFPAAVRRRAHVIPNPIPKVEMNPSTRGSAGGASDGLVIAMGRLIWLKGFDLLLRAFAQASETHPEWRLDIWGEGPVREQLEKLIVELGLESRVRLPGRTKEPLLKMSEADLFVLSSRSEGFPNVPG